MSKRQENYFGGALKADPNSRFCVIGLPWDEKSSFRQGAALAPQKIRQCSSEDFLNSSTELGIDLKEATSIYDCGDVVIAGSDEHIINSIEAKIVEILSRRSIPVILGGDHSVTYPVIRAIKRFYDKIDLIYLDTHPDLYPDFKGDLLSHACVMTRILELKCMATVYQIGIRGSTTEQDEKARRNGIVTFRIGEIGKAVGLQTQNPTYLSIDIDVLDPAFAPGVGNGVPGGISTRQLIDLIHSFDAEIIGFDVVEVNPCCDTADITSRTAAKIVMETIGAIVSRKK